MLLLSLDMSLNKLPVIAKTSGYVFTPNDAVLKYMFLMAP
jgi:pyridoxal biosynthesis lyase PdxS